MSTLTFFHIMSGPIRMGEGEGTIIEDGTKTEAFDRYWPNALANSPTNKAPARLIFSKGVSDINLGAIDKTKEATLQLLTAGVGFTKNFVTWSVLPDNGLTLYEFFDYQMAKNVPCFVGDIIANEKGSLNSFTQQTLTVPGHLLSETFPGKQSRNLLGIHSRDANGQRIGDRDNFTIANIVLWYYVLVPSPFAPFPGDMTVTIRPR